MKNTNSQNNAKSNGVSFGLPQNLHSTESYLSSLSRQAGKRIGEMTSEVSDTASSALQSGRAYVKQNPARSIAMAVTTGAIVSGLVGLVRRMRR